MDAFQQHPAVSAERRILLHVVDIYRRALDRRTAEMGLAQPDPPFAQSRHPLGTHAKSRFGHKDLLGLVELVDGTFIGLRELRRAADDRGEHGVEVERGIDRAYYFFERLQFADRAGQFVGASLQFAEQPRVLDRDDRLVGKGAHQFDLPLAERLDAFPIEVDRAQHLPVAQQRHPENRSGPGLHSLGHRVVRDSANVRYVYDPAFERHPPGDGVVTGDDGSLAIARPELGFRFKLRHDIAVNLALA
jgi:hypothetical protein